MTAQPRVLEGAVALLDRSLAYTRVVLAGVTDADLARTTPCSDWDLGELLAHMEDALDAFTEAAGGSVARAAPPVPGARPQVGRLQQKACALLGAWAGGGSLGVEVSGRDVAAELLVATAALEVAVHGWDVGEALGGAPPIPEELAVLLHRVGLTLVRPEDRTVRFGLPRPVGPEATAAERLLAHLGRA